MRPLFCKVEVHLDHMRRACGSHPYSLTAEQTVDIVDGLKGCWRGAKLRGDDVEMDNCSMLEVREIIDAIEDALGLDGVMDAGAITCDEVDDLDLDVRSSGICGWTDLTGFQESDWTEEADE